MRYQLISPECSGRQPSIHCAEFIGGEKVIRYDSVAYRSSMDKIADVLKVRLKPSKPVVYHF